MSEWVIITTIPWGGHILFRLAVNSYQVFKHYFLNSYILINATDSHPAPQKMLKKKKGDVTLIVVIQSEVNCTIETLEETKPQVTIGWGSDVFYSQEEINKTMK